MTNRKEQFLDEVLQFIKAKEAKSVIYKELNYHIKMSKSELVSKGISDNEAEEKAISQMGSPSELGTHFNKLYRPIFDWKLFGLFIVIISMGVLPHIYSTVYSENLLIKQVIYIVLGILVTITVMFIDYRKVKRFGWFFLLAALGLLIVLTFFPNTVTVINEVGLFTFFGFYLSGNSLYSLFLVFWAFYFSKEKPKLFVIAGVYLFSVFLLMRLPSLSDVFIYSILVFTLFICSSKSKKAIYTTIGVILGLVITTASTFWFNTKEYQKDRLLGFLNPNEYSQGAGYMYIKLKELISKGCWFGNSGQANIDNGMTSDFAFANITFYFGWILSGFLFATILLFLYRMIVVSTSIKDRFGKLLIIGVCSLLSIQVVYNVGMILGLFPIISMTLPFISYGLHSTVLNSILIGIVLSVYRKKPLMISVE
ncbi:cell division protein FtsW (lipid II flippase) [Metabacillus crassostreae]|uniref:FtsW/RodA/SpoVE family cell cycle protein n=1 Tax=Metabacillus crassostreae TaxID=929098 RepID=UPI001958D8E3|nr:FtsW/RodA/SpoVE family cell cycle protein [Metabacillus crassostreae]MBM7602854.1 cell division protein FtsW (lipid II flippase) [Metabacillus crassostreae]